MLLNGNDTKKSMKSSTIANELWLAYILNRFMFSFRLLFISNNKYTKHFGSLNGPHSLWLPDSYDYESHHAFTHTIVPDYVICCCLTSLLVFWEQLQVSFSKLSGNKYIRRNGINSNMLGIYFSVNVADVSYFVSNSMFWICCTLVHITHGTITIFDIWSNVLFVHS